MNWHLLLRRDVLYLRAYERHYNNLACKALYERLRSNEKSGKLALIAVGNKLLMKVFAVKKKHFESTKLLLSKTIKII